ncbi:nuclear transport factor 2 family protein [Erythrobacter alti]|uniref:nuclear transport factor 2 family protein n=1 Tax=Erythrobacter alti TaxID=1896145 RepID=UPI0030F3E649
MTEPAPAFADYVAICETKARYCRCLDTKDWAGYADVFTDGVVLDTRASGGEMVEGREQVVAMVKSAIGKAITVHQVHSPEIALTDPDTAEAIWAMQDHVVWDEAKAQAVGRKSLTGFGHYRETYRRCGDGAWRIARTELTRLHMSFESLTRG